jgi:hypothetical protein
MYAMAVPSAKQIALNAVIVIGQKPKAEQTFVLIAVHGSTTYSARVYLKYDVKKIAELIQIGCLRIGLIGMSTRQRAGQQQNSVQRSRRKGTELSFGYDLQANTLRVGVTPHAARKRLLGYSVGSAIWKPPDIEAGQASHLVTGLRLAG